MAAERCSVTERGRLRNDDNLMITPHDLAFPSAMSTLAAFMGLPLRTRVSTGHGIKWLDIIDHYTQVGISAEGFGFMYNLPDDMRQDGLFGSDPLHDCFSFLGLPHKLYADKSIKAKDDELNSTQEYIDVAASHMARDLPVVVLTAKNVVILAVGYEDYGTTLRGWLFSGGADNTNKSFDYELCQLIRNWADSAIAIITVGESCAATDKEAICRRALRRGYAMLTVEDQTGYGKGIYREWIEQLGSEANFAGDMAGRPYIDPHIWDLAERRAWTSRFVADAQSVIPHVALAEVMAAFDQIHDRMWDINRLCSGNNSVKLKDFATRSEIISILKECAELDMRAARHIGRACGG